MSIWLLCCTDGTNSWDYNVEYTRDGVAIQNQSYVRQFCNRAGGNVLRAYFDGPSAPGVKVGPIAYEAKSWLEVMLSAYPDAKIALVGHSRGGMISVLLARWLQNQDKEVAFMGLYDAVDRSIDIPAWVTGPAHTKAIESLTGKNLSFNTSVIPSNVKLVRHAIRDGLSDSRWWFGNTATSHDPSTTTYDEKKFLATHGAIGGSVPHSCETGDDWTTDDRRAFRIPERVNTHFADLANDWVKDGARTAGFPI